MSETTEQMRSRLLLDYKNELGTAKSWKEDGRETVSAGTAGPGLAKGRSEVPIDEYIQHWVDGIVALSSGADPELWDY